MKIKQIEVCPPTLIEEKIYERRRRCHSSKINLDVGNIIECDTITLLDDKRKLLSRDAWDKSQRYKTKLKAKSRYALL